VLWAPHAGGVGGTPVRPGGDAGHTAMKQEPGAAQAGKTGTARGPHEAGFVGYPATGQLVAVGRVVTHDH
jgi:membrane peptidoglycan carboxypeptidase